MCNVYTVIIVRRERMNIVMSSTTPHLAHGFLTDTYGCATLSPFHQDVRPQSDIQLIL